MEHGQILTFALIALYLLPAIVANLRKHHQQRAISVLNLLAGWTVVGWIAAMVWAFSQTDKTGLSSFGGTSTKKCPHCAETIKREATICRYCRSELDELHARLESFKQLR